MSHFLFFFTQLQSLGRLRTSVAAKLFDAGILSIPSNLYQFLWVTEFPLFSMETDDNGSNNSQVFSVVTS